MVEATRSPTPETGVTAPFNSPNKSAAEGGTHDAFVWVKVEQTEQ